jgi:hypothetical protein
VGRNRRFDPPTATAAIRILLTFNRGPRPAGHGRSAKFREGPLFLNPTAATGPLLASACEHDHRTPTWDTFVDACRGVIGLRFQPRAVSLQHSPRPPLAQFNYTVCGGRPPRHFLRLRSPPRDAYPARRICNSPTSTSVRFKKLTERTSTRRSASTMLKRA